MDATERLVPHLHKGVAFFYEHLLRYIFASQFTKGKSVIDLGCGSGYGSFLVAKNGKAKKVYGFDISEEAISFARKKYHAENIIFKVGNVENLKDIFSEKVDIVVAFEILEHLDRQEIFTRGIKKILQKDGLFIVSTPNTNTYPKNNPFHKRELSPKEFVILLKKYFSNVKIFHQGLEFAQIIKDDEGAIFDLEERFIENENIILSARPSLKNSQYLIAVCSDIRLPKVKFTTLTTNKVNQYRLTKGLSSLDEQFQKPITQINNLNDEVTNLKRHLEFIEGELRDLKSSTFFYFANKYYGVKGRLLRYFDFSNIFLKEYLLKPQKIIKVFETLFTKGPKGLIDRIYKASIYYNYAEIIFRQYQIWVKKNHLSKKQLQSQKILSKKFKFRPKISIITPTYNSNLGYLEECIQSVLSQTYDNFEYCLVDDASSKSEVREIIKNFAKKDSRIKYLFRKENGHIVRATNSGLGMAKGEYVAFLDHDDKLWPNALFEVAGLLNDNKEAELIYSDEDKLAEDGVTHIDPFFKPDFSPDYLRSCNFITHFCVIKKELIEKIRGFRVGVEGAQDWDLFLRATREIPVKDSKKKILHIPKVLYSWRKSEVSAASHLAATGVKAYAYKNQRKVLEDDIKEREIPAELLPSSFLGCWRVKYSILGNPLVSIIIPTRDKFQYISKCLQSLIEKTTYKNYEIILIDNNSTNAQVFRLYEQMKKKHKRLTVLRWNEEFNFAAVCNFGASQSKGEYLIFLNNDTEVISGDWIECLLEHAQREKIGAVGGKLLYPNGKVQHAGIMTGVGGVANHMMKGFPDNIPQGFPMLLAKDLIRNVYAVTGACFCIKKEKFKKVGGFNESFKIAYNDVDLCLRLYWEIGLFNLYTPYAKLYHHENISTGNPFVGTRNFGEFMRENELMRKLWGDKITDPFYNKNLTRDFEDCSIEL